MTFEYLIGSWRPQIGDPTFMGWFTVAAYFLCAIVAFSATFFIRREERKAFLFWGMIAFIMILLGINKQLDLQSLFTEIGRQVAKKQGWMEERRIVQFWFIVGFGATAITGFILFTVVMRNVFRRFRLAFIGLFFLVSFIIIRAASFHHFDEAIHFRIFNTKMNWILELGGIFWVTLAGIKEIIRKRKGFYHLSRRRKIGDF